MANELYHHGIKGMKWGVRRYQNVDGTYTKVGLKRRSRRETISSARHHIKAKASAARADRNELRSIKRSRSRANKNRSRLSDDELNKRIDRLQREKRLHDLTNQEVTTGKTHAKKMLGKYGGQIAGVAIGAAAGYAIRKYTPFRG